jgi:hypothetical protein
MIGGTAEIMEASGFKGIIFLPGGLTCVKVLDLVVIIESAAFQKNDLKGRVVPFQSDAETCGACADNAEITFYEGIVRKMSGIYMHEAND